MTKIKLVVFDLSGTTVNDQNAVANSLWQAATESGLDVKSDTSWLSYIELTTYVTGTSILILGLLSFIYFEFKFRKIKTKSMDMAETTFA